MLTIAREDAWWTALSCHPLTDLMRLQPCHPTQLVCSNVPLDILEITARGIASTHAHPILTTTETNCRDCVWRAVLKLQIQFTTLMGSAPPDCVWICAQLCPDPSVWRIVISCQEGVSVLISVRDNSSRTILQEIASRNVHPQCSASFPSNSVSRIAVELMTLMLKTRQGCVWRHAQSVNLLITTHKRVWQSVQQPQLFRQLRLPLATEQLIVAFTNVQIFLHSCSVTTPHNNVSHGVQAKPTVESIREYVKHL